MPRDDMRCPIGGGVKGGVRKRAKFGEERHASRCLADVVFGLRCVDDETIAFPVDVVPSQRQVFGREAKPAVPCESKDQLPLVLSTLCNDRFDRFLRHEEEPLRVGLATTGHPLERASVEQLSPHRIIENLLGNRNVLSLRVLVVAAIDAKITCKVIGIPSGDVSQQLCPQLLRLVVVRQECFERLFFNDLRSSPVDVSFLVQNVATDRNTQSVSFRDEIIEVATSAASGDE